MYANVLTYTTPGNYNYYPVSEMGDLTLNYNSEIEKHKERLEKILDGNIKQKRKSKKKSWFHKLLKKLKLKK